jgi:DNA-binding GntR family transcriptional regulator
VIQPHIEPIEDSKKTVAAIVQDRIRQAIFDNVLPAGSRIDQNQLATDLHVSLVPLREALKALESEGFVRIIPRRGAFVTETSYADMEDLYFTRQILEGQAAMHAAARLTPADLEQLDALCVGMKMALTDGDRAEFLRLNRDFHMTIYAASGSRYLLNMIRSLWTLSERYRYHYIYIANHGEQIIAEHEAIRLACHAGDAHCLQAAILSHMQQTLDTVRDYLLAEGEEGLCDW